MYVKEKKVCIFIQNILSLTNINYSSGIPVLLFCTAGYFNIGDLAGPCRHRGHPTKEI